MSTCEKRFRELQTTLMIRKARCMGGGLADLSHEENIDIMIEVMSSQQLHLLATEGYKTTGTSNKFDGTEDWKIGRDVRIFWEELVMRPLIDSAVADVQKRFDAGDLP